jgi:hypothetical protein
MIREEKPSKTVSSAVTPFEISRKISQNLAPADVRSPFVARAIPMEANLVFPVTLQRIPMSYSVAMFCQS